MTAPHPWTSEAEIIADAVARGVIVPERAMIWEDEASTFDASGRWVAISGGRTVCGLNVAGEMVFVEEAHWPTPSEASGPSPGKTAPE